MRRLSVFESVTLNGYFAGKDGDISWAHTASDDLETRELVQGNARNPGVLLFGRKTYEMMSSWWPTPAAAQSDPVVAKGMNEAEKIVFSRTLQKADWANARIVRDDPRVFVDALKRQDGNDLVVLGSGSIVAQLAEAGLVDEYQLVMKPVVLGEGRTLFGGVHELLPLTLRDSRTLANGSLVLRYAPAA